MIQKKVITLSRDDGHLVKSEEGCKSAVSEEKYYKPFIDLYMERLKRLRIQNLKEKKEKHDDSVRNHNTYRNRADSCSTDHYICSHSMSGAGNEEYKGSGQSSV